MPNCMFVYEQSNELIEGFIFVEERESLIVQTNSTKCIWDSRNDLQEIDLTSLNEDRVTSAVIGYFLVTDSKNVWGIFASWRIDRQVGSL